MKYVYWCPDHGETEEFPGGDIEQLYVNLHDVAEACAEQDYVSRNGWEYRWPIVYCIKAEDSPEVHHFSVDLEAVPSFHASEIKQEPSK